jgi:ribosomal peptide maturation radical SAM protein 1
MVVDVVFVNLPFAPTAQPSLAFSVFKPLLERAGFTSTILYPNLKFSMNLGHNLYDYIANYRPEAEMLLGELLFSQFLNDTDLSKFFRQISQHYRNDKIARRYLSKLAAARQTAVEFINSTAQIILRLDPQVVCFSSLFQQHTAALSLAKALRRRSAQVVLIVGGSNCEGEMGKQTAESFNALDFVVSGPGELVLPKLLSHLLLGSPPTVMDGVFPTMRREYFPKPSSLYAPEGNLDDLPYPDFDNYFQQMQSSFGSDAPQVLLPLETSRGCWWGVKHHCTFCGLNGSMLRSRQKEPERAFQEFRYIHNRYSAGRLTPVDNILPYSYFDTLIPRLAREPIADLFYEVKANLTYDQLKSLRDARVIEIQPGIESLSDTALRRMRKGVSALQNILLLRNAKQLGITVFWNILFGFPREMAEEYLEQLNLIDTISHLPPPLKAALVRIDRFSPLFFDHQALGIDNVRPVDAYLKAYPGLSPKAVESIAYYFNADYRERELYHDLRERLRMRVDQWRAEYPASFVALVRSGDVHVIIDTRVNSKQRVSQVTNAEEMLLNLAKVASHRIKLVEQLSRSMPRSEAEALIAAWISARFLVEIDDRLLSVVETEACSADVIAALLYRLGLDHTPTGATDLIRVPISRNKVMHANI